jgi:hypothetical protein
MAPKGFEPTTSQANASGSYHYTTYVFMSTSITKTHLLHLSPSPPATLAQYVVVDKYHRDS